MLLTKRNMRNIERAYSSKAIKGLREMDEIQRLISKMNLSQDSAAALNTYTTKICTEFEEKGIMQKYPIRERVAVSTYLACDGKACVAIPKLRAVAHHIPMKGIINARRTLKTPRGTTHQKLDSLCHICHINDKNVILRAHEYASLLDNSGPSPTSIAAAALSLADDELLSTIHNPLQEAITKATGVSAQTILILRYDAVRRERRGDK